MIDYILQYPQRRDTLIVNEVETDVNSWHNADYTATCLTTTGNIVDFFSLYNVEPYGRHIFTLASGLEFYLKVEKTNGTHADSATTTGVDIYSYIILKDGSVRKGKRILNISGSIATIESIYHIALFLIADKENITILPYTYNASGSQPGKISEADYKASFMVNYDNIVQALGRLENPTPLSLVDQPGHTMTVLQPINVLLNVSWEEFNDGAAEGIDPYQPITGNSTPGGNGSFNFGSDPFSFPSTPSISSASSGFTTVYLPSQAQLAELHDYMWNADVAIYLRSLFSNITDAIVGLKIMPTRATTVNKTLKYGLIGSGVTLPAITSFYSNVTFTLQMDKCFDSALDYEPYTKVEIVLPYYGSIQIDPELIQGRNIGVLYRTEVATGDTAIYVYTGTTNNYTPINTLYCNVSTDVIIAGGDHGIGQLTNVLMSTAALGAGALAGGAMAAGGAAAGGAAAGGAAAGGGLTKMASMNFASQLIGNVMGQKPTFTHSGSATGSMKHGHWGVPYLVLTRANPVFPNKYNSLFGYPCNYTTTLGNCSGFTSCQLVHININCTDEERAELEELLMEGVIL